MPKQYRSREGECTALDTKTPLTTMGPDTAPGALNVPQGASKLSKVRCVAASNGAATGSFSAFGRLEGAGLDKPYNFAIGAGGGSVATGQSEVHLAKEVELDAAVTPGNEILCFAEMAGADVGQISVGMTLIFE